MWTWKTSEKMLPFLFCLFCLFHWFLCFVVLETDSLCSKFDLTHVTDIIKDYGVIELKEILGNAIWPNCCNKRKDNERGVHSLDSFLSFFLDVSVNVCKMFFTKSLILATLATF